MMRLKLVEGTPPEAEYYRMMPDGCMFGERKGGGIVFRDDICNEWTLTDGQVSVNDVRPLPPGTTITITVRDAAPHDVKVVKPQQGAAWLDWWKFESGDVAVSKYGNWYLKLPNGDGYRFRSDIKTELLDMQKEVYRRPFAPWSLVPVEESEVKT